MTKTVAIIAQEIFEDLGQPAANEISPTTIQRKVTEALVDFNRKVGNSVFRWLPVRANVQRYDLKIELPTIAISDVKYAFNGDSTVECSTIATAPVTIATIVENVVTPLTAVVFTDEDNGTPTLTTPAYADIAKIAEVSTKLASASKVDFKFIEPSTLLLFPAPSVNLSVLLNTQENYTITSLPDEYEPLVTMYAKALCQEIVGNARARLNTPQRQGDYITFSKRELGQYAQADKMIERYNLACEAINNSRFMG